MSGLWHRLVKSMFVVRDLISVLAREPSTLPWTGIKYGYSIQWMGKKHFLGVSFSGFLKFCMFF